MPFGLTYTIIFATFMFVVGACSSNTLFREAGCRKRGFLSIALLSYCGVPSFTAAICFIDSKPAAEIRENVYDIPEEWTAAYMDHGKYKRWYTIKQRPVLFGLSIVGLVVGFVPCYLVTTYAMNDRKYKERGYRPPEEVENSNEIDPTD